MVIIIKIIFKNRKQSEQTYAIFSESNFNYSFHYYSIPGESHHNSAINLNGKSYNINEQSIQKLNQTGKSSPLNPILNKLTWLVEIRPFKLTQELANRISKAHFEEIAELVYIWTRDKNLKYISNYHDVIKGSISCFNKKRGKDKLPLPV